MKMQFCARNNDLGACVPTRREKMTSTQESNVAVAEAIKQEPVTPHLLNNEEAKAALQQIEELTRVQNQEALAAHATLNEQRISHLLGLLED